MIKKFLMNNTAIKIACLILAVFMWYALKNEETMTKTMEVYLSPKIHESMYLVNISPVSVHVTLSGSRKAIKDMQNFGHSMELDLTKELEPKIIQNELRESDFSFPENFNITSIVPQKIDVEIDRLGSKYLPVEAVTGGMVAANHVLGQIDLIPSRIKVDGPEKILATLVSLKTEKINIENMNTNFIQEVNVIPPFTGYKTNQSVKAIITINKSKEEKIFENIPVRILQPVGLFYKCTVKPSEISLKVSASTFDFQGISSDDFSAHVDITGLQAGVYELPVIIMKKDAFNLIEVNPKSVEVTVGDRV